MKNKIAVLLLAVSAFVAPLAAKADLIWYEGFNYPNGVLTNVAPAGLWTNFSGTADMIVSNHVLQVASTGGGLNRAGDEARFLGAAFTNAPQVLYASMTVICTNLPNGPGTYFSSFYNTSSGFSGRIQAFTNLATSPNTWRIGATGNGAATNALNGGLGVDLGLNVAYQVVARLDPVNLQACTIWINPISESDPSYSSSDSLGFATSTAINAFAFRQASTAATAAGVNSAFFYVTNVALATTFDEALTNVQPTNAVAPVFGTQPAGTTNFVNIPITLFGVVSGQGQMNITYQWYKGGLAFSNPNGNSPVLPFSSPQTTDSGSYTLVATTPYGLSTTSAPANVLISAQPVPPTITSGPASQSLYVGQNVTFSVMVSSPGNVSYQWKSNSVNIDGATSSSYTIANLQTNFAANYSVGVTNDVVANGVVSSNAVLTVSPAQSVSIGFLRSLVDPNTFLPTASPTQPFAITGVVTTFTNITSGNTASYWLQDSTGGINVFITGGSTFRPMQGDILNVTGVLSSFTSGLELDIDTNGLTQTSYTDTGVTTNLPTPKIIPLTITNNLALVNSTYAGSLVTIQNVSFGTNGGTTISATANQNVTVTNGAGQSFTVAFFDLDLDTAGQTLPSGNVPSITGILYGLSPTYSLAVTKFSDINTSATVNVTPIPLAFTSSGTNIVVSWGDPTFTLQSSTNATAGYTNMTGATSPYTNAIGTNSLFFRLIH
ncbi:MAG TPA: hypothetical protein VH413_04715 [Verrucomicrobiae bacterium]|jgi:hypothetical protein|nr:hypothetical protein [Verrucomicrobiae bacterium]